MVVTLGAIERQPKHRLRGVFDGLIEPAGAVELEVLPGEEAGCAEPVEVGRDRASSAASISRSIWS